MLPFSGYKLLNVEIIGPSILEISGWVQTYSENAVILQIVFVAQMCLKPTICLQI